MQQSMRGFGNALVVSLISVGLMLGALSISLVEFVPEATPTSTNILFASPIPLTSTSTLPPTVTPTLGAESPTPTITLTLPASSCQPPLGWGQIVMQAGDTLDILALRYRISKDELIRANCLLTSTLVAGTTLYVPPVVANTLVACSPGATAWVKGYIVKAGDTIYAIATNHYITAGLLKSVNCRYSDLILPGETLWVPNVATRTPYPTPLPGVTVTPHPTDPLTETALPFTATIIPTNTLVPATATPIPTGTAIPTHTPSPTAFPQ
ncbi:MAG: LysM peptidoglycan-binding domain-containing protein [Anaerolineales bacterium]|nr:LysM peptidoglycan-binding domain-containing protein [Anaerolineales bacterium]